MKRITATILSIGLVLIGLLGCSNAGYNVDATPSTTEMTAESADVNETEGIEEEKNEAEDSGEDTVLEADKPTVPDEEYVDEAQAANGLTAPFEIYELSKKYELEEELLNCCLNLIEDGRYYDFEGDIGEVLSVYKKIDIDGDGKTDTIERVLNGNGGNSYLFSFSDGTTFQTHTFTAYPNEGEIIELKDMDGDCRDEVLVTHYTGGTGGPSAWDVYMYYRNDEGKWEELTIANEYIQIQDIADVYGFEPGSDMEPRLTGVELTGDGIAILIDRGTKVGADQTFDPDVFLFEYEKGKLSLSNHSSELLSTYWPNNADGEY